MTTSIRRLVLFFTVFFGTLHAWKHELALTLRAEIRDFYGGSPAYNTRAISGGQHKVVAGGGLVLRFP